MEPKKTRGRQRIEIKRLEGNRQVTFTKRRKGLFNKASELCVATNAEVAILAQSVGGGRVFAFGHPNVDYVVDAYLGNNVVDAGGVSEDLSPMYEDSNKKYLEILEETEAEKTKVSNVEGCTRGLWWKNSVEDLEIDELEIFVDSMEKLKINLMKKADELRSSGTSSSLDEIANASVADGSVDDQVVLPNLDQFLQYNVGFANENLMMPAVNYGSSGVNNYGFGNEGLVLDNHVNEHLDGGDNLQDQSDFGTFGVPDPNDLYFSQD